MTCIISRSYKDKDGYAICRADGKNVREHRLAYCLANGLNLSEICGLVIRHTCDTPACVNPSHLLIGTQQDNIKDMVSRGRHRSKKLFGKANGRTKMSFIKAEEARRLFREDGLKKSKIAKIYGVDFKIIHQIIINMTWTFEP